MITRGELGRLKQRVWQADSVRPVRIYAVLDCARDAAIYDLIGRSYREKGCLFAGKLDLELERAAPFLLELQPGDSVTDEILLRGWDDAWGILIRTEASFRGLRRHLRTFLRVRTEDGRFLLFRYYDPRVLDAYLPTCTGYELAAIFGDDIVHIVSAAVGSRENRLYTVEDGTLHAEAF
jgi:hypothetical protein